MSEKIEVRYSHTALGPYFPAKHKYIIYTDRNGNEYVARGGPGYYGPGAVEGRNDPSKSDLGNIITSYNCYTVDHPDWDKEGDDPKETIISGEDLSGFWESIKQAMDAIKAEKHPYWPNQNSNTAVDEALRRAGLPEPQFDDFFDYWSPGSGKPLNDESESLPGSLMDLEGWTDQFRAAETTPPGQGSPIILDLDGDGVETMAVGAGAYFDHNADGFAESTGWVGADDGLLVFDRDGNGRIDSGRELFGSETLLANGEKAANGFEALNEFDANADGLINDQDAVWANLKVWRDLDGDGYSASNELLSLSDAGVASISTGYANSNFVDPAGNEHRQVGGFSRTDGTIGAATDVWFQRNMLQTIPLEWVEVPADIQSLPNATGTGTVFDLHQAMARDGSGALQSLVTQFIGETDFHGRSRLVQEILFHWADADVVDPVSRGGWYFDARRGL